MGCTASTEATLVVEAERRTQPEPVGSIRKDRAPWDPSDFDWCPPRDEDKPWEANAPVIPVGVEVRGTDGAVVVVPRAVHESLRAASLAPAAPRSRILPGDGPEPPPPPTAKVSCIVCFDDGLQDPVTFRCKQHYLCEECAKAYFQERVNSGCLPTCPAEGCGTDARAKHVQRLLGPKELDRYLMLTLRATQRLQDCPRCGAEVYLEELSPKAARQAASRATSAASSATAAAPKQEGLPPSSCRCPKCKHRFCISCGVCWHPNSSCEEAVAKLRRRRQREASRGFQELAQALGLKSCPHCGATCEKTDPDACDHMTCPACSQEFCWTCMADRAVIYAHGNHFHRPNCRFHFSYDGPPEFLPERCQRCRTRGRACTPPRAQAAAR